MAMATLLELSPWGHRADMSEDMMAADQDGSAVGPGSSPRIDVDVQLPEANVGSTFHLQGVSGHRDGRSYPARYLEVGSPPR